MSSGMVRKRTARASPSQLSAMLDFFIKNKGLAEGRFATMNGKEAAKKKWAELANDLNGMRGALKSAEQWQVVWRDIKSRTSVRAREIKKARAATGNKPITPCEFTDLEEKVLGIIGSEYVEGNRNCPDSLPEQEELLEALIAGDPRPLKLEPKTITIFEEAVVFNANNTTDSGEGGSEDEPEPRKDVQANDNPAGPSTAQSTRKRKIVQTPDSSPPLKQSRKSRNGDVANETRAEFREIAQKHADATMIMAQAIKSLAETAKQQAAVMEKIVQIENERTPVLNKLLEVMESLLPTYVE